VKEDTKATLLITKCGSDQWRGVGTGTLDIKIWWKLLYFGVFSLQWWHYILNDVKLGTWAGSTQDWLGVPPRPKVYSCMLNMALIDEGDWHWKLSYFRISCKRSILVTLCSTTQVVANSMIYVSVRWAHRWAVPKWFNWLRCYFGGRLTCIGLKNFS